MKNETTKFALIFALAIVALIALIALGKSSLASFDSRYFPSVRDLYAAKRGRVVDAETGAPIAHAFVVAIGQMNWDGIFVNVSKNLPEYRVVVETDDDGNFFIPAQPNPVWPIELHLRNNTWRQWSIFPIVPGFIPEVDEPVFATLPSSNRPNIPSILTTPPAKKTEEGLVVDDFKMKKLPLTLKQAVSYYVMFVDLSQPSWEKSPNENERIAPAIFNWMKPMICEVPANSKIDSYTTADLIYFAKKPHDWTKRLQELEPAGFDRSGYNLQYAGFLASNVCKGMTD